MKMNGCSSQTTSSQYYRHPMQEVRVVNKNFNVCEGSFKSLKKKSKDGCCTSFFKCLFFPCTKLIQWILGLCSSKRKKAASSSSDEGPSKPPVKKPSKQSIVDVTSTKLMEAAISVPVLMDLVVDYLTQPEKLYQVILHDYLLQSLEDRKNYKNILITRIRNANQNCNDIAKALPGIRFVARFLGLQASGEAIERWVNAILQGDFKLYNEAIQWMFSIIPEEGHLGNVKQRIDAFEQNGSEAFNTAFYNTFFQIQNQARFTI